MVHKSEYCDLFYQKKFASFSMVELIMRRFPFLLVFMAAVAGCEPPPALVNRAVTNIDFAWKLENEKFLEKNGSRLFKTSHYRAFVAAQRTLRKLGAVVEKQNVSTGFLYATAPAPAPLSASEWEIVKEADTTGMREIAVKEVGYIGWFASLDPSSKDILTNVYVEKLGKGVEVSIAMRMRSRKEIKGLKKRTQPPPTALRIGIDKFWKVYGEELRKSTADAPKVAADKPEPSVKRPKTAAQELETVAKNIPAPTDPRVAGTSMRKLSSIKSEQLSKKTCITFAGAKSSIDDVKKALVSEVKILALMEFFGEVVSSRSTVRDYELSQSVITGSSFGIVRTKGSPRFYNGNSLGEVCVEGEFFITQTDLERLAPQTVSEKNFCYTNEKLSLRDLRQTFRSVAISKALTKVNPNLKKIDADQLATLIRNLKFNNERVDMSTSALCADISFEIIPLEVESFVNDRKVTAR